MLHNFFESAAGDRLLLLLLPDERELDFGASFERLDRLDLLWYSSMVFDLDRDGERRRLLFSSLPFRDERWRSRDLERFADDRLPRGERERLRRLDAGDRDADFRLLLRWCRRSFERERFERRLDFERDRFSRSSRFCMDLLRFDRDLDRFDRDFERFVRDLERLLRDAGDDARFEREVDRFLERDRERREDRPFDRDRFDRDLDRFDRDFDRFDRDRDRRRSDRERDERRRLVVLALLLLVTAGLSFVDNIPMTGSMAAEIIFCASFTMVMASSISRCAASLLLASGFVMACTEW